MKESTITTRILLAQPKPGSHPETIMATLHQLHQLRESWPGIVDLTIGETTSSDYPYGAIVRFVQPYAIISVVHTPDYQTVIRELERHATVLQFDIQAEERHHPEDRSPASSSTYGLFALTVEEQLRSLVYLWFQGTGHPLTKETIMAELPQLDDFGLDLLEFDKAIEEQFGVEGIADTLLNKDATFADLLYTLETRLEKKKGQ